MKRRKRQIKVTRKIELEQNAVALACQRELVLQAVRRYSMSIGMFIDQGTPLDAILVADAKLIRMERSRNKLLTVRRPNRKKAKR